MTRQTGPDQKQRFWSLGAALFGLILILAACSGDDSASRGERDLRDPSAPPATRDPDVGRLATNPDAGQDEVLDDQTNDGPIPQVRVNVDAVVHVLGSVRTTPDAPTGWETDVPLVIDDLATVVSLSCDQGTECDPDSIRDWAADRVEIVNLATAANVLDRDGLTAMRDALAAAGVSTIGFGDDADEANEPALFEGGGITVAVHAVSLNAQAEVSAGQDVAGISGPDQLDATLSAIEASRDSGYGVVVLVDWSDLDSRAPGDVELAAVDRFVAAGADAIVGHGPDFLQRFDQVGSAAVAFSLGNAATATAEDLRRDSAVLRLEFATPGRSCLLPATASPSGPGLDDVAVVDCSGG